MDPASAADSENDLSGVSRAHYSDLESNNLKVTYEITQHMAT